MSNNNALLTSECFKIIQTATKQDMFPLDKRIERKALFEKGLSDFEHLVENDLLVFLADGSLDVEALKQSFGTAFDAVDFYLEIRRLASLSLAYESLVGTPTSNKPYSEDAVQQVVSSFVERLVSVVRTLDSRTFADTNVEAFKLYLEGHTLVMLELKFQSLRSLINPVFDFQELEILSELYAMSPKKWAMLRADYLKMCEDGN